MKNWNTQKLNNWLCLNWANNARAALWADLKNRWQDIWLADGRQERRTVNTVIQHNTVPENSWGDRIRAIMAAKGDWPGATTGSILLPNSALINSFHFKWNVPPEQLVLCIKTNRQTKKNKNSRWDGLKWVYKGTRSRLAGLVCELQAGHAAWAS